MSEYMQKKVLYSENASMVYLTTSKASATYTVNDLKQNQISSSSNVTANFIF